MMAIKVRGSVLNKLNICHHPGYSGIFTRDQAKGAWPNGTRIAKIESDAGDQHADGAMGTVLGSISYPTIVPGVKHFYFIEWDDSPTCAIAIIDTRIKPIY